ncbi:MAG: hypothetical protein HeimAB125_00220 [Candidatus Heimdallarchaeota archaeon AB_125]|nr:MAG: hypothetical protein HeimAB125_00220 [Candidatus Heimdallarchaeota archaeon AB_125]
MVSILQSLKVSILFLFLGLIPLLVAILSFAAMLNNGILNLGFVAIDGSAIAYIWLIGLIVGLLIFFVGLFKAIGDITESALIE